MIRRFLLILLIGCCCVIHASAQETDITGNLTETINNWFLQYNAKYLETSRRPKVQSLSLNDTTQTLVVSLDEFLSLTELSSTTVKSIYKGISGMLPSELRKYKIEILSNDIRIEELVPNRLAEKPDKSRQWGNIEYRGEPWVENVSRPHKITQGLYNRHLSLWASHGRFYDQKQERWRWQRPNLFGTTEDLFTQTIVVPYLIPMLENAGAVVFTPRERNWQKNEVIVDNDTPNRNGLYTETNTGGHWETASYNGFACREGTYIDGENPFDQGTVRMIKSSKKKNCSQISYQPQIPETGKYAVYVSYLTLPNSIDDAQYIVYHQGQETEFRVNQTMGDGTWVYLGTFEFDRGCNTYNRVVLTNYSRHNGVITADAVRFGGGMGNIERGGMTSGMPRCIEGARYYGQWAGAPYSAYSSKNGTDDYGDDINARSHITNWLAGGSAYVPEMEGKSVPIELSLGIHSDAGYSRDFSSLIGTLSICTTQHQEGILNSGISRMASRDFADALLDGVYKDILHQYGHWTRRYIFNRNYSESRLPEVPSSILETLSHQNFPDMVYGQDPNFKFTLARSIYKTILRYVAEQHNCSYTVQPLQPDHFRIEFTDKDKITLRWNAVNDPQEPTAEPSSYNIYMATGTSGFDNGTPTHSTSYSIELEPDVLYSFKVTAVNKGGESFPTEVLSAAYHPKATRTVLVVNGFHRLSSPAIRNTYDEQGFDLDEDPGVTYGATAGWNGRQICFDKSKIGIEGYGGLGYGGDEYAGQFIAGNDFNYVTTHAEAILSAHRYNIASCSSDAVEGGEVNLNNYECVDLVLGLEKDDGRSLVSYKAFKPAMQQRLTSYLRNNGRLFVSGSYIGSDMTTATEQDFLSNMLKLQYVGSERNNADSQVDGMGTTFNIYRTLNEKHYAATSPDIITPVMPAYCALQYSDGQSACVAYSGKDYRCLSMGFPFECITTKEMRSWIMKGVLQFLLK